MPGWKKEMNIFFVPSIINLWIILDDLMGGGYGDHGSDHHSIIREGLLFSRNNM